VESIDRIYELIKQRGITAAQLTRDAGLTNGLLSQWKKGLQKPSSKNLKKIADYFNVTTDYLLSGSDKKISPSNEGGENSDLEPVILARSSSPLPKEEMRRIKKLLDSTINSFLEAYNDEQNHKQK
jgi:transcriptional regulator with XRE-family HTH domain